MNIYLNYYMFFSSETTAPIWSMFSVNSRLVMYYKNLICKWWLFSKKTENIVKVTTHQRILCFLWNSSSKTKMLSSYYQQTSYFIWLPLQWQTTTFYSLIWCQMFAFLSKTKPMTLWKRTTCSTSSRSPSWWRVSGGWGCATNHGHYRLWGRDVTRLSPFKRQEDQRWGVAASFGTVNTRYDLVLPKSQSVA